MPSDPDLSHASCGKTWRVIGCPVVRIRQVKEDETMRPKPNLRAQMPASGLTQVDGTAPVTPGSAPVTPGFVPPFDSAAKEMEKRLE